MNCLSPLVPANVDLTDFPFMPLLIDRLKRSRAWLSCKRRPELAFYMLNLWTASWHSRPAASLENDDDVLADLAMCSLDAWDAIKADALRGWVECGDGKLYHPVIAELALSSWSRKVAQRARTEEARKAKLAKRQGQAQTTEPTKPADGSVTESVTEFVADTATETVTGSKGQGQGEGQGDIESPAVSSKPLPPRGRRGRASASAPEDFRRWYDRYPHKVGVDAARKAFDAVIRDKRATVEDLITGTEAYIRTKPVDRPWCNPATWLNGGRWKDRPAGSTDSQTGTGSPSASDPIAFEVRGRPITAGKALELLYAWKAGGPWHTPWGAPPDDPACIVPTWVLEKAGITPAKPTTPGATTGRTGGGPRLCINGTHVAEQEVVDTICRGEWVSAWGPTMGQPGCKIPERVVRAVEEMRAARGKAA